VFRNFYAYPCIIRVISSMIVRFVGHVACAEGKRSVYRTLVDILKGRNPLERLDVEGRRNKLSVCGLD
jgi:hypothetical protein